MKWRALFQRVRFAMMAFRHVRTIATLLFVLSVSLWMIRPYSVDGFPYTHDGENHLARFMNYAGAIREGQIPPRFAPFMASGYGFPVFTYNYPLANVLAVPYLALGMHPAKAFAQILFLTAFLGVWATYSALRKYFSIPASIFGTLVFASSSYWAVGTFFRGNTGELLAYCLAPMVVVSLLAFRDSSRWRFFWRAAAILSLSAFFLAHNVMALLGTPFLLVVTYFLGRKIWREWLVVWIVAILLSLWFWIPALIELKEVVITGDGLAQSASLYGTDWAHVLFAPLRFGFERVGIDSLGYGIGGGMAAMVLIAIALWVLRFWEAGKNMSRQQIDVAVVLLVAIKSLWLASDSSHWVWVNLPFLSIVQFPWRFLWIFSLVLVPLSAWMYSEITSRKWQLALWILVGLQIANIMSVRVVDRIQKDRLEYLHFSHTTTTHNENRPKTLALLSFSDFSPAPKIATGTGEIQGIDVWKGSRRKYRVRAVTDVVIVEPTVYFLGWKTLVDGSPTAQLFTDKTLGQIAYSLPARPDQAYQIETNFGERTWDRWLGDGLTLFGLLALVILFGNDWQKRKS